MMRTQSLSDLATPMRVALLTLLLVVLVACRPAEGQGLTITGKGWSVTFWSPPLCGGPSWYHQPRRCPSAPGWGYNPGYYGERDERGSYSRDWNLRSGRWNEHENIRTPSGSYRRSTTCDPRWGCQTEVTRTERFYGPYLPPPP